MVIFGLGTHKVQNFGFFWVLLSGTHEDWVPKIWVPKGNTQTIMIKSAPIFRNIIITMIFFLNLNKKLQEYFNEI